MSNLVSLDLAGEFQTHISSPSLVSPNGVEIGPASHDQGDVQTTPLFSLGKTYEGDGSRKCSKIPTIHVGAKYDFKNAWYGATRLMSSLSWGNQRGVRRRGRNVVSKLQGEVGLLQPNDYSLQLALKFPKEIETATANKPEPTMSFRFDTQSFDGGHCGTVAASTMLHPRLGMLIKGIVVPGEQGFKGFRFGGSSRNKSALGDGGNDDASCAQFLNRVPQNKFDWSEGSWLPDVKVTAGGKIVTNSAIGLKRNCSSHNRIGVRFKVSRQLNWNLIGAFQGNDENEFDNETILRLEVGGVGSDSYTSISAEAAAERIPQTLRCTLLQEKIFRL